MFVVYVLHLYVCVVCFLCFTNEITTVIAIWNDNDKLTLSYAVNTEVKIDVDSTNIPIFEKEL